MPALWTILGILSTLAVLTLITAFICFRLTFFVKEADKTPKSEFDIPPGEEFLKHREDMIAWMTEVRALKHEELFITSHDGLRLRARFFDFGENTPIEIMLHGYRGNADRDLSGGVIRARALGHSVLLIDHRAAGKSEGNVITFGVLEKRDALLWASLIAERFPQRKIILTGISMGAATVMMCAKEALPQNVVGILADCGYTSPRAIISKVLDEDLHLPSRVFYPFVYLGARLFGGFDLHDAPPVEALAAARVPVLFFHGDTDGFVPSKMSEENFAACAAEKKLVFIEGAGHGLAYPVNKEKYLSEMRAFFSPLLYEEK